MFPWHQLAFRLATILLAVLAIFPLAAGAQQEWPAKPIRLIVPFPPGGSVDTAARIVGQELGNSLGKPIVVENISGAGGNIGVGAIARSSPDGYTIGVGATGAIAINVSRVDKPPFDPVKDLAPITLLAITPIVLVAHPSVQVNSVQDLVALAKRTPGGLLFASSGTGGALHLAGELFKLMTGAPMTHVPYKGSAPAIGDLLAGQELIGFVDLTSALPQIRAGRLKAIGTTGRRRTQSAPDLATIAEAGLPDYSAEAWVGLFAPAGTPEKILARLNDEVVGILASAGVRRKMLGAGLEPMSNAPKEFAQFIQSEIPKWANAIKASGVRN